MRTPVRSAAVILVLVVTTADPSPLAAQVRRADVVGLLRRDGFVVPFFEWSGKEWLPVGKPGESNLQGGWPWQLTSTYFARDSQGRALTLKVGSTVKFFGQDPDIWGHLTDLADTDVEVESPVPRIGYAVSIDEGHAPFVPLPSRQQPLLTALFSDSLGILEKERLHAEVWGAVIGADSILYFHVTRHARGPGCPDLHVYEGWIRPARGGAPEATEYDRGDCEGKGALRHHPWALIRRDQRLFALLTQSGWEASQVELWSVSGEQITEQITSLSAPQ